MRNAPIVPGVPTPYFYQNRVWPSRFHGPIYTRPMFGFPERPKTQEVFTQGYNLNREVPQPTLSGLGATVGEGMLWETGNGVFKPGGYGGGVFDGDISGLGSIGPRTIRHKKSRARTLRGLGAVSSTDMPWKTKADATIALQSTINAYLLRFGMCPISVDGKLGPGTCGAARYVLDQNGDKSDAEMPDSCTQHRSEWTSPTKNTGKNCGVPVTTTTPAVPTTNVPVMAEAGMSSSTKRMLGFALGGVLAVGAVVLLKKKR